MYSFKQLTSDYLKQCISLISQNQSAGIDDIIDYCSHYLEEHPEHYEFYALLYVIYLLQGDEESINNILFLVCLENSDINLDLFNECFIEISIRTVSAKLAAADYLGIKTLHDALQEINPNTSLDGLTVLIDATIEKLLKDAVAQSIQKNFEQAIALYEKVLTLNPDHVHAWHNLGMIYFEQGDDVKALEFVTHSLALDETIANHHYSLGFILEQTKSYSAAKESYLLAIQLNSSLIEAYNHLGIVEKKLGNLSEAKEIFQKNIHQFPEHFGAYLNLGNWFYDQKDFESAIDYYEQAIQRKHRDPDILYNLALAYESNGNSVQAILHYAYSAYRQKDFETAVHYFEQYFVQEIGTEQIYLNLAECYEKTDKIELAIQIVEQGIQIYPDSKKIYLDLAIRLISYGFLERAETHLDFSINRFPNEYSFKRFKCLLVPVLYDSEEEITLWRNKYIDSLKQLIDAVNLDSPESKVNALQATGTYTNFFLQYQGLDDTQLQCHYAELVYRIMAANFPQWTHCDWEPSGHSKIRIGYVSASMYWHTVGKLMIGWLRTHDHEQFEIFCYYPEVYTDFFTTKFQIYADHFRQFSGSTFQSMCDAIVQDKLDILVFLDVGMHATMTQLVALRLAPIQCTTWGHPITTGSPNIDYFLSSDLMEPANGQEHYSETLIRLPNLGIYYSSPELPQVGKKRSDFNLPEDGVLYLSCQSLYKYLPQYDDVFPEIAVRNTDAKFVFISSNMNVNVNQQFLHRIQNTFNQYGLDYRDFCFFLPTLNQEDYLMINQLSDIYLDTFTWSGGNTTLEAIACHLPVVTCPGEFMRGRHSYAILKMIGVEETIATSKQDYIEVASRLGTDPVWYQEIHQKLVANAHKAFDDITSVRALEDFYQQAVAKYRA